MARRYLKITLTVSLAPGVTAAQARREVRTRVNDLCCYSLDEGEVRVQKMIPGGIVAGPGRKAKGFGIPARAFASLGDFMHAVRFSPRDPRNAYVEPEA